MTMSLTPDERARIEAARERMDENRQTIRGRKLADGWVKREQEARARRPDPQQPETRQEPWWTLYTTSWRHTLFFSVLLGLLLLGLWLT